MFIALQAAHHTADTLGTRTSANPKPASSPSQATVIADRLVLGAKRSLVPAAVLGGHLALPSLFLLATSLRSLGAQGLAVSAGAAATIVASGAVASAVAPKNSNHRLIAGIATGLAIGAGVSLIARTPALMTIAIGGFCGMGGGAFQDKPLYR